MNCWNQLAKTWRHFMILHAFHQLILIAKCILLQPFPSSNIIQRFSQMGRDIDITLDNDAFMKYRKYESVSWSSWESRPEGRFEKVLCIVSLPSISFYHLGPGRRNRNKHVISHADCVEKNEESERIDWKWETKEKRKGNGKPQFRNEDALYVITGFYGTRENKIWKCSRMDGSKTFSWGEVVGSWAREEAREEKGKSIEEISLL